MPGGGAVLPLAAPVQVPYRIPLVDVVFRPVAAERPRKIVEAAVLRLHRWPKTVVSNVEFSGPELMTIRRALESLEWRTALNTVKDL